MRYVPWEAIELTDQQHSMPPTTIVPAADGMIGLLPVYATRAAAEAASDNGRFRVQQILPVQGERLEQNSDDIP